MSERYYRLFVFSRCWNITLDDQKSVREIKDEIITRIKLNPDRDWKLIHNLKELNLNLSLAMQGVQPSDIITTGYTLILSAKVA